MDGLVQSLIDQIPVWSESEAFPETVWVLEGREGEKTCFSIPKWDLAGLAVFSNEHAAYRFGEWLPDVPNLTAKELPMIEAWEVALRLGQPVKSLLLLDRLNSPRVFPI